MILKCNNGSIIAGKATKSSGTMENNHAYIWLLIVIHAIVVLEVKLKQLDYFFSILKMFHLWSEVPQAAPAAWNLIFNTTLHF